MATTTHGRENLLISFYMTWTAHKTKTLRGYTDTQTSR
jgi:hypothetical protein